MKNLTTSKLLSVTDLLGQTVGANHRVSHKQLFPSENCVIK
ncbi:hypothetical protein M153_100041314 [Pseudoloma neurophilia]|uniref:Uncharacterized protein n=1 Tax=Pseudoloma neurophilia TaxID=146866 RepID=A0A0R0M1B2_9MICR|nr:hypothetical protein M153_100041314 [Pseudoloma neurophilia]